VTFCVRVNGVSGTFQLTSSALTSVSRPSVPARTRRKVAKAVTTFEIDPAWKSVSSVTRRPVRLSATPYCRIQAIRSASMKATLTPGTS
jgi:hypothetical protein